MRYVNVLVLLTIVVLAVEMTRRTPESVEPILRPGDYREQHQQLRKLCRETLERYRALYRDQPVETWPSARARLTYTNAQRVWAEMEDTKP